MKEVPQRAVKAATVNRYRASLCGFATYLVNLGLLSKHPIRDKKVKALPEGSGRMPTILPEEWDAYLERLKADPLAPEASDLVATVLRYTAGDVGEVIGYVDDSGTRQPGMIVRDIDHRRDVPQIRFARQKVDESGERSAPLARCWTDELVAHIDHYQLGSNDEVFAMVDRGLFEKAHKRAVRAIGRPDITLKDFRHFAAQTWAAEGARLEHMKVWMGHSSITQTEIYSRFMPTDTHVAAIVEAGARSSQPRKGPLN